MGGDETTFVAERSVDPGEPNASPPSERDKWRRRGRAGQRSRLFAWNHPTPAAAKRLRSTRAGKNGFGGSSFTDAFRCVSGRCAPASTILTNLSHSAHAAAVEFITVELGRATGPDNGTLTQMWL
jgi:hypothetical protein